MSRLIVVSNRVSPPTGAGEETVGGLAMALSAALRQYSGYDYGVTFLSFLFSLLALRRLTATAAGITASSEVIFAFLVAWLWLGEQLTPLQLVGAAGVLAGIVLAQSARADKVIDADLALPSSNVGTLG